MHASLLLSDRPNTGEPLQFVRPELDERQLDADVFDIHFTRTTRLDVNFGLFPEKPVGEKDGSSIRDNFRSNGLIYEQG